MIKNSKLFPPSQTCLVTTWKPHPPPAPPQVTHSFTLHTASGPVFWVKQRTYHQKDMLTTDPNFSPIPCKGKKSCMTAFQSGQRRPTTIKQIPDHSPFLNKVLVRKIMLTPAAELFSLVLSYIQLQSQTANCFLLSEKGFSYHSLTQCSKPACSVLWGKMYHSICFYGHFLDIKINWKKMVLCFLALCFSIFCNK